MLHATAAEAHRSGASAAAKAHAAPASVHSRTLLPAPCVPLPLLVQFEGHHLRVDRAAPKAAKGAVLFDHTRSLFVGNLPLDAEVRRALPRRGRAAITLCRGGLAAVHGLHAAPQHQPISAGRSAALPLLALLRSPRHASTRNVRPSLQDEELIRLFGAEGVEAVRVVRDARSGAGKGVAFVLFRSQDASRAALKQHRKSELRGRQLRLTLVKKGEGGVKGGKAAWQQGKGGGSSGGGGSAGKGGKLSAGKRKTGGKRPAVAARKAATKLKARPGDVQKR